MLLFIGLKINMYNFKIYKIINYYILIFIIVKY